MTMFLRNKKPSGFRVAVIAAGVVVMAVAPARADLLKDMGATLTNSMSGTLNQSVQNTQNGVQSGVQQTIRNNTPHANEVNAAKNVATTNTAVLNPKMLCSQVPAELQTKYTRVCASFDPNNPCSALPIAGSLTKQQTKLQSLCNAQNSLTNLQGQAAAKVTPSAGQVSTDVNQQLQNQLNTLMTRH